MFSPIPDRPLLVKKQTAQKLLDCGNTKFWALVKAGKIRMVDVGTGHRLVAYDSLEQLTRPTQTAA